MCRNSIIRRLVMVPILLMCTLFGAQQALAVQASGSISPFPTDNTLEKDQLFTVPIRVNNTSTETGDEGTGNLPAILLSGGQVTVTLACTDSACGTQLPNTLEFINSGVNGCVTSDPGVGTCTAVGDNQVVITIASDIVIPGGGSVDLAIIQLQAENPVLMPVTGNFSQRIETGPNDLEAESILNDTLDPVTGSATGSTSYLFPGVCDVLVDKQISCDGGTTWIDQGLVEDNEDGTNPCSATDKNMVMVRYEVSNSGDYELVSCGLTETNPGFGTPNQVIGGLLPGASSGFLDGGLTPICEDAQGAEPNTAEVICECAGFDPVQEVSASDLSTFACLPSSVQTDRAVDCGTGAGEADNTLVSANEDTTRGCTATNGSPVRWEYCADNNGAVDLFDCTLVDQNNDVTPNPIVVGDLISGQQICDIPATNILPCSDDLELDEAPDGGRVDLVCCTKDVDGIELCDDNQRVMAYDVSTVTCAAVGLDVTKECVDIDGDRIDEITITASNTGEVDLLDCIATDTIYLADETCPPAGVGSDVPVTPNPFNLAASGGTQAVTGSVGPLDADACNTTSVTCTIDDGSGATIGGEATAVCPGQPQQNGCLTRTPGFWGTHPEVAAMYLNVDVCGVTLDNTNGNNTSSTTEAICSVGKDGKILGSQLTQLVRQCTAAQLNINASIDLLGDCTAPGDFPLLAEMMAGCCSDDSICTGSVVDGYDIGSCITRVDAFNNDPFDTLNFGFKTGPANSRECRKAKNNGLVVEPVSTP